MGNKEKKAEIKTKLLHAENMSSKSFLPENKRQMFIKLVKKYRDELKKLK